MQSACNQRPLTWSTGRQLISGNQHAISMQSECNQRPLTWSTGSPLSANARKSNQRYTSDVRGTPAAASTREKGPEGGTWRLGEHLHARGRSWVIRGHQWQSEVIIGHQRSSEVIRGHQWSSEVIRGHQRSSEVIRGHQRSSEVIRGHQRQSEAIRAHQRSSDVPA